MQYFCEAFLHKDSLDANKLHSLLAPDCRLQNKYGNVARGVNGMIDCIAELRRIRSDVDKLNLLWNTSTIYDLGSSQSLLYITAMAGEMIITIAVAVEWECSVVSGIVFSSQIGAVDPDTLMFLMYCNEDGEKDITGVVLTRKEVEESLDEISSAFDTDFYGEYLALDIDSSGKTLLGNDQLRKLRLSSCITRSKVFRQHSVRFHDTVSVVLIPRSRQQDFRKSDSLHYSSVEYKRFSRDMDAEVEDAMRASGQTKEQVLAELYGPECAEIYTTANIHVIVDSMSQQAAEVAPVLSQVSHIPRSISDSALLPHSLELLAEVLPSREREHISGGRLLPGGCDFYVDGEEEDERTSFGRRSISMDDLVDRKGIEEQQLSKQVSWLEQHDREHRVAFQADNLTNQSKSIDSKEIVSLALNQKKVVAPIPGCLLKRYLPPPRTIYPTVVHISVIACNNLKPSVFWPVVPVNSYVRITVDGESQCTEVVHRHRNPLYDTSQVYTFALSCENALHGYIDFAVLDKAVAGNDSVLGMARVAFAALKAQSDNSSPTSVILPLQKKVNQNALGRGFWNSDNYDCAVLNHEDVGRELTHKQKRTMSILSVTISKVDVTLHDMLRRLQQEDDERNEQLGAIQWLPVYS